jgi:GH25 family lysozyme M1 (1,4-beta-N-acetylmuramidase)
MGLKYAEVPLRGTDVSQFNGVVDWSLMKAHFVGIRVGYGDTKDTKFPQNWAGAKKYGINRMPYWYLDYYSNWYNKKSPFLGMDDVAWGRHQAEKCWSFIKDDANCSIVFLDIENGQPSYSPPLTNPDAQEHAETTARAFLERMDELNGKFNGIYASVGWLQWFYPWFRNRPLWVAWYNDTKTPAQVTSLCTTYKWTGQILIWQYASDGDLDDNGTSDGMLMGSQIKTLDLNYFLATQVVYSALFNANVVVVDPPPVVVPPSTFDTYKVTATSLNMRQTPDTTKPPYGALFTNTKVKLLQREEKWSKVVFPQEFWVSNEWIKKE